ncbi:unnamed protein product [Trichobilharzia szidati]|nr:unnamed protein product [Trichobilharzia szidati]
MFKLSTYLTIMLLVHSTLIKGTESVKCYKCDNCAIVNPSTPTATDCGICMTQFQKSGVVNRFCARDNKELPPGAQPSDIIRFCSNDLCNNLQKPNKNSQDGNIKCYKCDNCRTVGSDTTINSNCGACLTQFQKSGVINRYCVRDSRELPPNHDRSDILVYCHSDTCNSLLEPPKNSQCQLLPRSHIYATTILVTAYLVILRF